MILTRRAFSALLSITGATALLGISPFKFPALSLIDEAAAQTAAEIATPSPLGDMALGPENATVTIIEYASMTCPHCANFTNTVFPKLKSEYIDSGKVRFIFREFPLDEVAAAGSIVARCIAKDNSATYFALVDAMFKQQNDLARTPLPTLKRIGKQAGMSEDAVEACLDKKTENGKRLLDGIVQTLDFANTKLKVNSTPFFFVNGTPLKGDTSFEAFDKMLKPLIKS